MSFFPSSCSLFRLSFVVSGCANKRTENCIVTCIHCFVYSLWNLKLRILWPKAENDTEICSSSCSVGAWAQNIIYVSVAWDPFSYGTAAFFISLVEFRCVRVFFARMVSFFFRLSFIFISSSWFSFIFNLFFMYDYRILGARSLTCLVSLWFVEFQYINRYLLVT